MRIAVLIRRFITTGGAERYAVEVVQRLAKVHEVHVFTREWDHPPQGITIHHVSHPFKKPGYIDRWWFSLRTSRLTRNFEAVYTIEKVARFDVMSVQSQTFVSGLWPTGKSRFKIWLKVLTDPSVWANWLLERIHYRQECGRYWVAVSQMTKRDVQAAYPIPDNRFFIAPSGVDLPAGNTAEQRAAFRRKLGFTNQEVIVLFVGSEFRRKGLDALIAAFGQLKNRRLKLLVVGSGDPTTYQKQAADLGVGENIIWSGLVKQTSDFYAAADIYVLPTLSDPSPLSPLEAMAHGCAVVMSGDRFNGAAEHVKNNEAILLGDPQNPAAIADAITHLLDPEIRAAYARRGRQLVAELPWDGTAKTIDAALTSAVREKSDAATPR